MKLYWTLQDKNNCENLKKVNNTTHDDESDNLQKIIQKFKKCQVAHKDHKNKEDNNDSEKFKESERQIGSKDSRNPAE